MEPAERAASLRRGMERMVYFSDAVVAIAITLIVLPLVDAARDFDGGGAFEFIKANALNLLAALVSFFAISRLWMAHHQIFVNANGYTTRIIWLNLGWLVAVVFLPLSTVLLVAHSELGSPFIYVLNLLVATSLARLLEIFLVRDGLLQSKRATKRQWVAMWVPELGLVIGLICIALFGSQGSFSLLILIFSGFVYRLVAGPDAAKETT